MSERASYLALGLEPGAPSADIKRAYRNLSLRLHPDASKDPRTASRFSAVAKAYGILSVRERDERRQAPRTIMDAEPIDIFDLGAALASDTDPEARIRAARRLGLSGKRSAWVFLRKGLYDTRPEVVAACVGAASALGLAQGAGEIAGAYERGGPFVRDAILEAAKATGDGLFSAALEVAKADEEPRRRAAAYTIARELRSTATAPAPSARREVS